MLRVFLIYCLADLIRFLEKIAADAFVSLFDIPWTTAGRTKNFYYSAKIFHIILRFTFKIYHTFYPSAS